MSRAPSPTFGRCAQCRGRSEKLVSVFAGGTERRLRSVLRLMNDLLCRGLPGFQGADRVARLRVSSQLSRQGRAQAFFGQDRRAPLFADVVRYGFIEQVAAVAVLGFGNLIELGDLLSWNPEAYGAQVTHIAREYAVLQRCANRTPRRFFVPIPSRKLVAPTSRSAVL